MQSDKNGEVLGYFDAEGIFVSTHPTRRLAGNRRDFGTHLVLTLGYEEQPPQLHNGRIDGTSNKPLQIDAERDTVVGDSSQFEAPPGE